MHRCAIDACHQQIHDTKLMCPPHWALVPTSLQYAVYNTWGAYFRRRAVPTPAVLIANYNRARELAVAAVHQLLGMQPA